MMMIDEEVEYDFVAIKIPISLICCFWDDV